MRYRYIQTEEKGKWRLLHDGKSFDEQAKKLGAVRSTILSISHDINDEETDLERVGYAGPLYFDIDSADLNTAIISAKDLLYKLDHLEVPKEAVEIYCSGSKGFHVIVPHTVFLDHNRTIKDLPKIYMEMALDLYVLGMDFEVYSAGMGRMFRPVNGLRPDGRYRVRIAREELETMTQIEYLKMVSAPRELSLPGANGATSVALSVLFEKARGRVRRKVKSAESALTVEELLPFADDPPQCVVALVKGSLGRRTKFNQAGFQLASFIARSGTTAYRTDSLLSEMAESGRSTTYGTPAKRKTHLQGLVNYAKAKPSVAFLCGAIRASLAANPCHDCPLADKNKPDAEEDEIPVAFAKPDGYYITGDKLDRKVTTFTLLPLEVFMDPALGIGVSRRIGTSMDIFSQYEKIGHIYFDEIGWRSKGEFLRQFEGIKGLGFIGNDVDVQKIKMTVYQGLEDDEVDEVTNVYSAGIHLTKVGKNRVYTYVEAGLSVNNYGIRGTHVLQGKLRPPPILYKVEGPEPGDKEMENVLRHLMAINSPEVMAQLIGWHALSHLKTHISSRYKQFPSVNLWGAAGSGKTMTSMALCFLNGVDYMEDGDPLMASTTTAWPLIKLVGGTTTIPRIIEEYNKAQIKKHGIYELVTEIIKASFNGLSVPRGTLSKSKANSNDQTGAEVTEMEVSAPLIVCSEQLLQKSALQQRMIQLHLSNASRQGRDEFYYYVLTQKEKVLSFSKALTMMALKTKDEWIADRFLIAKERVPNVINDRSRYSYAMLFVGLDFFHAVAHSLNLDLNEEVGQLRIALAGMLHNNLDMITRQKVWSEVDNVVQMFGEMAQLGIQDTNLSPMVRGKHFVVFPEKDELVIDLSIIYPMYRRHSRAQGVDPVFDSLSQLIPLMESEPYFKTRKLVLPEMANGRKLWALSLSSLKAKGHDIDMFKG